MTEPEVWLLWRQRAGSETGGGANDVVGRVTGGGSAGAGEAGRAGVPGEVLALTPRETRADGNTTPGRVDSSLVL
jgi:hypothetical protein